MRIVKEEVYILHRTFLIEEKQYSLINIERFLIMKRYF